SLSEGEREGLNAFVQELNSKDVLADILGLANQLIQPLLLHGAIPIGVGVIAMIAARWRTIQEDPKAHRVPAHRRAQHQMQVTRFESKRDAPPGLDESRLIGPDYPGACQCPLI